MPKDPSAPPRVLILAVRHGSTHLQIARVLERSLHALRPDAQVEVVDALEHCRRLFRTYYDGFEIPMKYWPGLWEAIETRQYRGATSGPEWLYRWGARPLFRFIEAFAPCAVVATEVGLCEMAALHKREAAAAYALVGVGALDFERPWAQPEVDLFISSPGEVAEQLRLAGVAPPRMVECGLPVDPRFAPCADRRELRARLGIAADLPVVLVNFGGSGRMLPRHVMGELRGIAPPFQCILLARRDEPLYAELVQLTRGLAHVRILRWVDNMFDWMAASDVLVSRAGSCTVAEAMNCGLPIVVFDAPPGSERRVCSLVERNWQTGYWTKRPGEIRQRVQSLLANPGELARLRANASHHAQPCAALDAARAILGRCG